MAAWLDFSGLGHYDPFYDTGVYLESARMISRGYAAYAYVFSSQPPLWLPLVRVAFFLAGESFLAGQLLVAAAGLITLAAVMATVAQIQGRGSAALAAILIIVTPTQVFWSRAVIAETPCAAFAAAAIALATRYHLVRRPLWLVLATIAVTCSILTKLFGIYTLPAVLMLVITAGAAQRKLGLKTAARDLSIMALTSTGVILLFVCIRDPLLVWDQAVRFHLLARFSDAADSTDILKYWDSDILLWVMAPLAALSVRAGWAARAILLWTICTAAGLLQQQPLFSHHLIMLVPAFAAATAIGLGRLWTWQLRWWSGAGTHAARRLAAASGTVLVLAVASLLLAQAYTDRGVRRRMGSRLKAAKADKLAAAQLRKLTRAGDFILTDAPGIAFLANRDVPPGLTDTSFKRISTRYLQPAQVIAECERFDVKAALVWTNRLSHMPEVMVWVRSRFPQHQSFGKNRELYFTRQGQVRAADLDPNRLFAAYVPQAKRGDDLVKPAWTPSIPTVPHALR